MIREIIVNDCLTIILFITFFFKIILKKINPILFYENIDLIKKDLKNKISNNLYGIKLLDVAYNILFISNLSVLFTIYVNKEFNIIIYFKLFQNILLFFLLKYILDLLIGKLFITMKIMKKYVYLKIIYFNSLGILASILNLVVAYTSFEHISIISFCICLTLILFIFSYFSIFVLMKKIIYKNWFYFILYLCTLEIIPYYYLISSIL